MIHYECWTHTYGDNFLVRMDDANVITGVCGPFRQSDIPTVNMPNYDYDSQPKHAAWVSSHKAEFRQADEAPPMVMD
jgi:hypothetical protein